MSMDNLAELLNRFTPREADIKLPEASMYKHPVCMLNQFGAEVVRSPISIIRESYDANRLLLDVLRQKSYGINSVEAISTFHPSIPSLIIAADSELTRSKAELMFNFSQHYQQSALIHDACSSFATDIRLFLERSVTEEGRWACRVLMPQTPEMDRFAERCFVRSYEEGKRIDESLRKTEQIYRESHPGENLEGFGFDRAGEAFAKELIGKTQTGDVLEQVREIEVDEQIEFEDKKFYGRLKAKGVQPVTEEELKTILSSVVDDIEQVGWMKMLSVLSAFSRDTQLRVPFPLLANTAELF